MRWIAVLAALLLAGCASSATTGAGSAARSTSTTPSSPPASSSSAPSTPAATLQHPIPAPSTSTGPLRCAQTPPYQVTIYRGADRGLVTCRQANAVAAKFNRGGDAVQRIDGYTCQLGTAQTRPIIFTCSSTGAEFTAYDAVGPQTCPPLDKYRIRIVSGQITCTSAADVAAQYRTQGASVQRIDGYTCQSGNAMTRPTVFTCSAGEAEFAVDQH